VQGKEVGCTACREAIESTAALYHTLNGILGYCDGKKEAEFLGSSIPFERLSREPTGLIIFKEIGRAY